MHTHKHEISVFEVPDNSPSDLWHDRLFTEAEVAQRQTRAVKTLQNQRVNGDGIPFLKLGRNVRYRLSDVIAWEQARVRTSTSDPGFGEQPGGRS